MTSSEADLFRELTRAVFATQTILLRHGDMANASFGQTSARWRVMLNISLGHDSVAGIARLTGYSRQAVQRLADVLVADELATYEPAALDRRRQLVRLSKRGQMLLKEMEDSFEVWSTRLVGKLTRDDVTKAIDALNRIRQVVESDLPSFEVSPHRSDV